MNHAWIRLAQNQGNTGKQVMKCGRMILSNTNFDPLNVT